MKKFLISLSAALVFLMSIPGWADTAPARVDDDHDGIDDRLEQALAERYAPIIFIEPDESNYPVNVEWFLHRAHLQYHEDCTLDVDDDSGYNPIMNDEDRTTQDSLIGPLGQNLAWSHGQECGSDDSGYSHPPHHRLSTISADPDGQWSVGRAATTGFSDQQTYVLPDLADRYHVGSTDTSEWKTYFHAYPTRGGGVMIQYWHLFAYNELGVGNAGNHGGDWDASIQVQLDHNLLLEGVWFSRHSDDHPGDFFPVGDSHLHFEPSGTYHTHPLMSIDGGGHAAFADLEDYCDKHAPVVQTTIVLPRDYSDPTNLTQLHTAVANSAACGSTDLYNSDGTGIIWETWTDGKVRTTNSELTHPLDDADGERTHGGLVNLGEYNPCPRGDNSSCYKSWQESTLLAGQFYPLNEQVFIRYSGKWGSLRSFIADIGDFGQPPRGPVFQGFHDGGSRTPSYYTSWYNQGADSPAAPDNSTWRADGPNSTLTIGNPVYIGFNNALFNGVRPNPDTYVSNRTPFTISAKTSNDATRAGYHGVESGWRFYPSPPGTGGPVHINPSTSGAVQSSATASSTVPYNPYSGPFTLSGPDGMYNVDYYSLDGLDNGEVPKTKVVVLDSMPPSVTITAPAARAVYTHDMTLTLNYSAKDSGSGLASSTASMDRQATVGNHGLRSGQVINLLTEMVLGSHTFKIDALDRVGNLSSVPAFFQIIATTQSIKNDVTKFFSSRAISSPSERNKLMNELDTAAAAYAGATCATAYQPFVDEVQRQRGEGIQANAADIMIGDAQYLTAQCHRGL